MDNNLKEKLDQLKKDYIDVIMIYLTTGVFSMNKGVTYIQAHTYTSNTTYRLVWNIGNRDVKTSPIALYGLYKDTLSDYGKNVAAPNIAVRVGKKIIDEFVLHWERYTILVYWLFKPFQFLVV